MSGPPEKSNIRLQNLEMGQLSEDQKKVMFEMERNKAPRPDGFPADFYKQFWVVIKNNLKAMIDDFYKGIWDIKRLNYGVISLIPKCKDAAQIQKFRPIRLFNVSFKIITRTLMKRLTYVIGYLIEKTQIAFLK